ncbi:hypothetical protein D9753_35795 [Streptomyces dangxiongensis]|uniref:Integrase n=1 Tax=Streptomyces dangxiongensis TaxID=1442032 RepID=A0A3G2JQR4_9ACTN|nr:hypothetical protein D9753_35795 [Streptomyces dangxiongensis]
MVRRAGSRGLTEAFDLLRWFRFLAAVDVDWSRAKRVDVRDFVLWLRTCHNPAWDRHRPDAPAPGSLNARTGKPYLKSGYAPATINHAVSVLAAFYDEVIAKVHEPYTRPEPAPQPLTPNYLDHGSFSGDFEHCQQTLSRHSEWPLHGS